MESLPADIWELIFTHLGDNRYRHVLNINKQIRTKIKGNNIGFNKPFETFYDKICQYPKMVEYYCFNYSWFNKGIELLHTCYHISYTLNYEYIYDYRIDFTDLTRHLLILVPNKKLLKYNWYKTLVSDADAVNVISFSTLFL